MCENFIKLGYTKIYYKNIDNIDLMIFAGKRFFQIPENSVVLTPTERDEEMRLIREDVIQRMEATRKETAEKFAKRLTKLYTGLTPVEEATGYTSIKDLLEMINAVAKEITEGSNG